MTSPTRPVNARVLYPDGSAVVIRALSYVTTIDGAHYWLADEPTFVPWRPGARAMCDTTGAQRHVIVVGYDISPTELAGQTTIFEVAER